MRTQDILWVIGIVFTTILFLKWGGFLDAPLFAVPEQQTPLEAVTELQNNYNQANEDLKVKENRIEYLNNLIGKDKLEYIKDLESRPTKRSIIFEFILGIICGASFSYVFTSLYKNKKMDKYRDEMWNRVNKLPNKYTKIFGNIEGD